MNTAEWDDERGIWVHTDDPIPSIPVVTYREDLSERWWCTTHKRIATYVWTSTGQRHRGLMRCCNPKLGGILLPCQCERCDS
jgi:hypothetical protein